MKNRIDEGIFSKIVNSIFDGLDSIILPTYEKQAKRALQRDYPDLYKAMVEYENKKDDFEKVATDFSKKMEKKGLIWDYKEKMYVKKPTNSVKQSASPYTKKK